MIPQYERLLPTCRAARPATDDDLRWNDVHPPHKRDDPTEPGVPVTVGLPYICADCCLGEHPGLGEWL